MRKIIITTIVSAVIVAVTATFGVRHYTQASTFTATDADVDHDGYVTILDLSYVAHFYGQAAPLPTVTPLPLGGGGESLIARGVVLQSGIGATTFYVSDPSVCPGPVLYMAMQSLVATSVSVALNVFGNGWNLNADPAGSYYVFQGGNSTRIDVTPLGSNISIAITLELHCRPTLP